MDCLASIVRDGISIERIEAALHQLELSSGSLVVMACLMACR